MLCGKILNTIFDYKLAKIQVIFSNFINTLFLKGKHYKLQTASTS